MVWVTFLSSSAPAGGEAAAVECVEAHGEDEDRARRHVLGRGGLAEQGQAVLHARDDEGAEDRVVDAPAAAEEARPADHGGGDRLEQEDAAADPGGRPVEVR